MWGNTNYFYIPTASGDKKMEQFFFGASYTAGPFTIGANAFWGTYAGERASTSTPPPAPTPERCDPTARQRRYAYSVGGNYRLAPGLDLVAEWVRHVIHEPGVDTTPRPTTACRTSCGPTCSSSARAWRSDSPDKSGPPACRPAGHPGRVRLGIIRLARTTSRSSVGASSEPACWRTSDPDPRPPCACRVPELHYDLPAAGWAALRRLAPAAPHALRSSFEVACWSRPA